MPVVVSNIYRVHALGTRHYVICSASQVDFLLIIRVTLNILLYFFRMQYAHWVSLSTDATSISASLVFGVVAKLLNQDYPIIM
jgi:hypothetical protein